MRLLLLLEALHAPRGCLCLLVLALGYALLQDREGRGHFVCAVRDSGPMRPKPSECRFPLQRVGMPGPCLPVLFQCDKEGFDVVDFAAQLLHELIDRHNLF